MEKRVKYLVVDSGALIKASPVHEYAENIYTVNGAVKEIKDKATLQRLQFLPFELNIKVPTAEACKYVQDFAKKTGDYLSLSPVDFQIIALTYQLEKEYVGLEHLTQTPSCQVTDKSRFEEAQLSGFYVPKKVKEDAPNTLMDHSPLKDKNSIETITKELQDNTDNASSDDNTSEGDEEYSEDESWLTPQNIVQVQESMSGLQLDSFVTVACVTTDFAIQNVLIQMGLKVISVDGMLIKQTRVYILRCFSCFKTTNNTAKVFCPNCGNKTLKRVAVTVNDDGSKNIHINFKRPINIRGMRYSLPMPKGGKHSTDPIVVEDQPIPQNRPKKKALDKMDIMSEDYICRSSPFALHDVYSRASRLGVYSNNTRQQLSKTNLNASSKKCQRKRK